MTHAAADASPSPTLSWQLHRAKEGEVTLSVKGRLGQENAVQFYGQVNELFRQECPKQLTLDLDGLEYLDDFGVAVLFNVKTAVCNRGALFQLIAIPDPILRVLSMHRFSSLGETPVASRSPRSDLFSRLGETVLDTGRAAGMALTFLGDTGLSFSRLLSKPRLLRGNETITHMQRVGVDALPIVGLISFLLGLIMAFMSSVQLAQFGANIYVASLVSLSMTRELGPIMTAIIVAGRSGSAFAAEIGSMKISEEVDALFTMGIDPHIFLVLPRVIATLLTLPILTLFSDIFAISGGLLVGITMLDLTVNGYMDQTIRSLSLFDVFWGAGKAGIFAMLISWTGCLRGFQVQGGAAGVGRATTSAVVTSIFLIILSDSLLVVILRYWEG